MEIKRGGYTDAEAIAAVEGEATLDLTGEVSLADILLLNAIAEPSTPATGDIVFYSEVVGGLIKLYSKGPDGTTCEICSFTNSAHVNELQLNWVE